MIKIPTVAGIFPFNPDVFGPNDYVASPVTDRPNPEATAANASPAATGRLPETTSMAQSLSMSNKARVGNNSAQDELTN